MKNSTNSTCSDNNFECVPTKASLLKKNTEGFTTTVFQSHKSKIKTHNPDPIRHDNALGYETEINRNKIQDKDFDIKKAKHDVINFAISGSTQTNKKKAQIALAIKLGAKPLKNDYKNYKELLNEKRLKKEQEDEIGAFSLLGKNQYGASTTKCRKKRKKTVVAQISKNYGVVNSRTIKK